MTLRHHLVRRQGGVRGEKSTKNKKHRIKGRYNTDDKEEE